MAKQTARKAKIKTQTDVEKRSLREQIFKSIDRRLNRLDLEGNDKDYVQKAMYEAAAITAKNIADSGKVCWK